MEIKDKIIIASDFSDSPGARYIADGPNSGQEFLENILLPKFERAIKENYIILIDLDNVWGYPSSFVSGSFGKLSIQFGKDLVFKHISFKSDQSSIRLERINLEITKPRKNV